MASIESVCGKGAFGSVSRHPNKNTWVVKKCNYGHEYSLNEEKKIIEQIFDHIHSNKTHMEIISHDTLLLDPKVQRPLALHNSLAVVFPDRLNFKYCEGVTLYEYMSFLNFTTDIYYRYKTFKMVAGCILRVFSVIHSYNIFHADIHDQNLMICKQEGELETCRVIDFGLGVLENSGRKHTDAEYQDICYMCEVLKTILSLEDIDELNNTRLTTFWNSFPIWYKYYYIYPNTPPYKSAIDLLKIYEQIEPKHEHNSAWPDVPPYTKGGKNNKYIHTNRSIVWPKNASGKYAKYTSSTRAIWTKDKNEYVKVKGANGFEYIKISRK